MMNRAFVKILSVVLMLCMLLCSAAGCSKDTEVIEQRVMDFVVKCNELDLDGILRCVDPSVSEPIMLTISGAQLLGKFTETKIDKYVIFDELTTILTAESGLDATDFFESIDAQIVRTEVSGNTARVYSNISYVISDMKFTKEGIIHMIEQADVWYVSGLEFAMFD